jgi:hypothetical protein
MEYESAGRSGFKVARFARFKETRNFETRNLETSPVCQQSEESGNAFFQHHNAVLNPRRARFLIEQLQGLIHRLVR